MSLLASDNGGKDFKRVPVGVFPARCFSVIDLGTQQQEFKGDIKLLRKVQIGWELYGEDEKGEPLKTDDGEPMSISKRYTLSLSEKSNLRPDLEAWRGRPFTVEELKGFDLEKLIGVPCYLNITHTERGEKVYANVASIMPLPKAIKDTIPPQINPNRFYTITDGRNEVFDSFYDKLKEVISKSVEFQGLKATGAQPGTAFEDFKDDIPF
jgi:hypothetical protein